MESAIYVLSIKTLTLDKSHHRIIKKTTFCHLTSGVTQIFHKNENFITSTTNFNFDSFLSSFSDLFLIQPNRHSPMMGNFIVWLVQMNLIKNILEGQ